MKFSDISFVIGFICFLILDALLIKSCTYDTICHDTMTNSRERGTFVCIYPGKVLIKEIDNKEYYICSCPK